MACIRLLSAAVVLLFARALNGADRFDGLDAYVREAMQKWEVPGLAIAAIKDDELVLARGYGICQVGSDRKVTPDTIFSIASCTKSFTAACIGMLVDEKRLAWDDAVQKHWPPFVVADEYITQHATLRDLLSHRTGLVAGHLLFVKGEFSNDEVLRRLRFLPPAEPFRTKVTYNNLMYEVLGQVIEQKSGVAWRPFVEERLLRPLGMDSTFIGRTRVPAGRLATRHRRYDGVVSSVRNPFSEEVVAPSGAIHSSVVDMTKWLKLHLHEGEHQGNRLLEADTVRDMHALVQSIPVRRKPDANVYAAQMVGTGFGWWVSDYRSRKIIHHGGGWGAHMVLVPDENLAVVVLSNLDWNSLVAMLASDVVDSCLVGSERAFSKEDAKWDFWLDVGGPEAMFRSRTEQKVELEKNRVAGTKPSFPLERYAGRYESVLYGQLTVEHQDGRLSVKFGIHGGELDHWQDDQFYGSAVVEPFLDWLVKFHVIGDNSIDSLEVVSVGWKDPDEKHIFQRQP